jgi:glycosyltransferase involved in cell wall biosynthesis
LPEHGLWRLVRLATERAAATPRVLLISSFVRPHPGGVEEFVDSSRAVLEKRGLQTRVLACRLPGLDTSADALIPTRFVGSSSWPLPTGGWRPLWREVSAADVIVANNARHLLPVLAVLLARARGRAAFLVMHGSGEGPYGGSRAFGLVRGTFQRTLGLLAMRLSHPVSVSQAGVEGARRLYGVEASYLPYPLRELPAVSPFPTLDPDRPLRIAWVGRLFPEKDPLLAVQAVENLRRRRDARLHVCGDGPLRPELERLARQRPWLVVHGARSWEGAQALQAGGHACLATSVADNVQVTVLEALSRGIPTVSTRIGDAPSYYLSSSIRHLCVAPRDPDAAADALYDLACSYDRYRPEFAANANLLRARHADAGEALVRLLLAALPEAGTDGSPSRVR